MTYRITEKMLQMRVDALNKLMGSPLTPYTRDGDKFTANIGNYHLSGAYGGWSLHRMVNEGGGVSDVFSCGHCPKRELFDKLCSFIRGIEIGKEQSFTERLIQKWEKRSLDALPADAMLINLHIRELREGITK